MSRTINNHPPHVDLKPWQENLSNAGRNFKKFINRKLRRRQNHQTKSGDVTTPWKRCVQWEWW